MEKIDKYQDLRIKSPKVWNVKVVVIPVVIGDLGTMPRKMHHYIKQIDILADIISTQKRAILGTAYILRRELGI